MDGQLYDFGMVGLGTMGRNLLLNIADHGFTAIGFDKDISKGDLLESAARPGSVVKGVDTLAAMVSRLKTPRKLMMLVPAGPPVDSVINDLIPLLEPGDVVIDGGNSHYTDTLRRIKFLQEKKIHFMGMGVSGGEQGARTGPSIMPGGDIAAWETVKPILEAIAARVNEEPCVAYMGKDAAGHYVKMVHNGIEYGIMQMISEAYDFLKRAVGLNNDELHTVFAEWNKGDLQSFLIQITAAIFLQKDELTDQRLVDMILDKAGSKGTGKWTSQEAMDLPISLPTVDMAVAMRDLSVYKDERIAAALIYKPVIKKINPANRDKVIGQVHDALYVSILVCYAQGLAMLYKASIVHKMEIPLKDVVNIWRGGCIIRSTMLEVFTNAFRKRDIPNILADKKIAALVKKKQPGFRKAIQLFAASKVPAAALMSSLAYLDAYTSERTATNLIQAQRDFFGAHTYQRLDKEGVFHTEWTIGDEVPTLEKI